ncbi:maltase 2-like isoform X2 [Lycorma delicatula]
MDAGVNTYWLGPIYKSPMIEGGYDISDFNEVDPLFGDMDDFKTLMDETKKRDMHVILDFVPNHTSDQHEWFQKSIKKEDPYTDYYIWRDGKLLPDGNLTYPNNWLSIFGGRAWTWNEERGQYYFHQFIKHQPDLNYRNNFVRQDVKKAMKFWLDLGVDGFRVDAVNHLVEDKALRDEPYKEGKYGSENYDDLIHLYTRDQNETYDVIYEFRRFLEDYRRNSLDKHDRIMITEAYTDINKLMLYYTNGTEFGSHLPFNFLLMDDATIDSNAADYVSIIRSWVDNMPNGHWLNWVGGNHDNNRIATRMGDELVDAFYMLIMLLPGTAVVYQGEEIGQQNNLLRSDQIKDHNNIKGGIVIVRDPPRGPFLWDDSENAGFTKAKIPWEPIHPSYWESNLKTQTSSKQKTHYQVFKSIAKLRSQSTIQRGYLNTYVISKWVFAFSRELPGFETYIIVINVGSERELVLLTDTMPLLPELLVVNISSTNSEYEEGDRVTTKLTIHDRWKPLVLRPKASVVLIPLYNETLPDEPSTNKPIKS